MVVAQFVEPVLIVVEDLHRAVGREAVPTVELGQVVTPVDEGEEVIHLLRREAPLLALDVGGQFDHRALGGVGGRLVLVGHRHVGHLARGDAGDDLVVDLTVVPGVLALHGDAPLVGGVELFDHRLDRLLPAAGVLVPVGHHLPAGIEVLQVAVDLHVVRRGWSLRGSFGRLLGGCLRGGLRRLLGGRLRGCRGGRRLATDDQNAHNDHHGQQGQPVSRLHVSVLLLDSFLFVRQ